MAIKIKVPNPNYSEYVAHWDVEFKKGVGIFEDEAKAREIATTLGYEIIEETKPKKSTARKGGSE